MCRFLVHPGPTFPIDRHVIPAAASLLMSHASTAVTFVLSFPRGDPACVSSVGPVFRLATDLVRAAHLGPNSRPAANNSQNYPTARRAAGDTGEGIASQLTVTAADRVEFG